jgi:hypothetical protein
MTSIILTGWAGCACALGNTGGKISKLLLIDVLSRKVNVALCLSCFFFLDRGLFAYFLRRNPKDRSEFNRGYSQNPHAFRAFLRKSSRFVHGI